MIIGGLTIPIQMLLLVVSNSILVRELSIADLSNWYLFLSLIPLFSVLELSLPVILLRVFSEKKYSQGALLYYLARMVLLIICVQVIVATAVSFVFFENEMIFFLFISGVVVRSVGNLLIVYPYAKGYVVLEKIYKFLYSSINPVLILTFIFIFSISLVENLYFIWFLGSIIVTFFSILTIVKVTRYIDNTTVRKEKEILVFEKMKSIKMLLTSLPGLFIFNLSIYYLDVMSTQLDVAAYGLFLQLLNVFYVINNLIPSVFVPRVLNEFKGSGFKKLLELILLATLLLSLSTVVFILLNGASLLSLLFGGAFSLIDYQNIAFLLALVISVESVQVVLTYISTVTGCYKFYGPGLLSAVLVALGGYLIIPDYGFTGLILVICISQVLTCLPVNLYISLKHLDLKANIVIYAVMLIFAVYGISMIVADVIGNFIFIKFIVGVVIVASAFLTIIRITFNYTKKANLS